MDERDPVQDDEAVLRRIHRTFFDPTLPIAVRAVAFRPNDKDIKWLSVFRARFVQPPDTLLNIDPTKARHYYVARLSVRNLQSLGLTVQPDPIPGGPLGHALIPEINWHAYRVAKQHWKPILVELAKMASADIVLKPA